MVPPSAPLGRARLCRCLASPHSPACFSPEAPCYHGGRICSRIPQNTPGSTFDRQPSPQSPSTQPSLFLAIPNVSPPHAPVESSRGAHQGSSDGGWGAPGQRVLQKQRAPGSCSNVGGVGDPRGSVATTRSRRTWKHTYAVLGALSSCGEEPGKGWPMLGPRLAAEPPALRAGRAGRGAAAPAPWGAGVTGRRGTDS